jgi:hypothetical protein
MNTDIAKHIEVLRSLDSAKIKTIDRQNNLIAPTVDPSDLGLGNSLSTKSSAKNKSDVRNKRTRKSSINENSNQVPITQPYESHNEQELAPEDLAQPGIQCMSPALP